jgi:hypothetical protein
MKMNKTLGIILLAIIISSCARRYNVINTKIMNYYNKQVSENVEFSYIYDIQFDAGNKRYTIKEKKNNLAAIAIKITNNRDSAIHITRSNLNVKSENGDNVPFIDPKIYCKRVRQSSEIFLLYAIMGVSVITTEDEKGNVDSEFYYNPLYAGIALGNFIAGEVANSKHKKYITQNQVFDKTVQPGQTVYGILIIPENNYPKLVFHLN